MLRLFPTAVHDTARRGLYRLLGGSPCAPLFLSAHAGGDVWEFDWQSTRVVRRYHPPRSLLQRLLHPDRAEDGLARPLHAVRALTRAAGRMNKKPSWSRG